MNEWHVYQEIYVPDDWKLITIENETQPVRIEGS